MSWSLQALQNRKRSIFDTMKYILIILMFLITADLIGQPDTIVVYNVRTQSVDFIPPVAFDSTITFESTSFSIGAMGHKVPLDLEPPVDNLLEGTQFTELARAELFFDVTTYPARTAVKLFAWRNDTLRDSCSGTMVSENLVLTAAHCIIRHNEWRQDSLLAAPAFDNGKFQHDIPKSIVKNYYLFKTFYEGHAWDDIALLELRDPIGFETGWQGIAFNTNTTFFTENVFHKFSYPAVPHPFDTTRVYNGDTLYYNYGLIDFISYNNGEFIGLSNVSFGIPGQSGSSLFYTNNHEYYAFGVLNFPTFFRHYLINQNVFYQFKNIIENHALYLNDQLDETYPLILYPNPASERVTVEIYNPDNHSLTVTLYDIHGRMVKRIENISGSRIYLHRNGLSSGIYIVRLHDNTRVFKAKQIIFR